MQHFSTDHGSYRNIKITIMYDGNPYHGWQIQNNAVTVQETFQKALNKIIGDDIDIKGCSRTDTGVHANMYCIGLKTSHPIPLVRLKAALNNYLPESIAVLDCEEMQLSFHPRYDCTQKQYVYKIWNNEVRNPFLNGYALYYRYKCDENVMNDAAQKYLGVHDFTSFCTPDKRRPGDFHRTVYISKVERKGDLVVFTVAADGFLYNMVRIMTGTLLRVAQGKISPDDISYILEQKDRHFAGPTAPACGLYLDKVIY